MARPLRDSRIKVAPEPRIAWSGALALALAFGCAPDTPACPSLWVDGWQWIGVVGGPGSVEPNVIVDLYDDDHLIHRSFSSPTGSFAIRYAVRGGFHGGDATVVAGSHRFTVHPTETEAVIAYAPHTQPVVDDGHGTMTFSGWLGRVPHGSPIARAWAVDWSTGDVVRVSHTPTIDRPFAVSMPGGLGHCMTIFSEHADGRTGGCWWPRGGGCLCRHCTTAQIQAGTCHETFVQPSADAPPLPCGCNPASAPEASGPDGGGRAPLPVDERYDPPPESDTPPPPEYGAGIPTDPVPPDAWVQPVDAWIDLPDAGIDRPDTGPPRPPS